MKKLFIIAALAMASCAKQEGLQLVDVVENQGTTWVNVNGAEFAPGCKRTELSIGNTFQIKCYDQPCRVNVNGAVYTQSGVYVNTEQKKGKL